MSTYNHLIEEDYESSDNDCLDEELLDESILESEISITISQLSEPITDDCELHEIIKQQNILIENLKEENKLLLASQIEQPINNEYNMTKLVKFIKIIYGLSELAGYLDDILIYGSLFENFFSKKSLHDTKLYFMFQRLQESHFKQFIERLHDMDYIINEDYDIKKRCFICLNEEIIMINHWDLRIQLTDDLEINVTFHDNTYTEHLMFDCQNIILTKTGLTIKTLTEVDIKNKRKYPSLSLLNTLSNITENKIELTKIPESVNAKEDLFECIEKQNDYLMRDFEIKTGFNNDEEKEQTCAICYREHKEDGEAFLYKLKCSHSFCSGCLNQHMASTQLNNHENCPLCRQKIQFGVYIG